MDRQCGTHSTSEDLLLDQRCVLEDTLVIQLPETVIASAFKLEITVEGEKTEKKGNGREKISHERSWFTHFSYGNKVKFITI